MRHQQAIIDYFSSIEENQIDELYVRSLEERIRRLERVVYAENISDLRSLFEEKKLELKNTIKKISSRNIAIDQIQADRKTFISKEKKFIECVSDLGNKNGKDKNIYIDITQLLMTPYITGIQRVAHQVMVFGFTRGLVPIFHHNNEIFAFDFSTKKSTLINLTERDWLLLPNASWMEDESESFINSVARKHVKIATLIYDLIPLKHPNAFTLDTSRRFKIWFGNSVAYSSLLICISNSVKRDVNDYIEQNKQKLKKCPNVETTYLGNDFKLGDKKTKTDFAHHFISNEVPYFLSVGTVEPRKGYKIILDAMEELWEKSYNVKYAIVGRYGWLSRNLENRIISHAEYNRRLFWWQEVSDVDLRELYKSARVLICGSVAEGFGLPIIEAANYGLPAICSDIEVFREITDNKSIYFEVANSKNLADLLAENFRAEKLSPSLSSIGWDLVAKNIISFMR